MAFKNLPIQEKFKTILIINAIGVLMFILVSFCVFQLFTYKKSNLDQTDFIANMLSMNISAPLSKGQVKTIDQILSRYYGSLNISALLIFDNNMKLVSKFYDGPSIQAKLDTIRWESAESVAKHLKLSSGDPQLTSYGFHAFKPVMLDGEKLGTIHLFMDRNPFFSNTYQYLFMSSMFLLFATLLAVILANRLQGIFTSPIIQLIAVVKKISESKEFSETIRLDQTDELGDLANEFNKMLHELDKKDKRLQEYHHKLESEVHNRTKQLFAANEKLSRMIKKSEYEREKAEQASTSKSTFVANMSHEIRTPLNGMLGMLEILRKTTLTDQQLEYLKIAQTSADTLLRIINDILDFSKIEADQIVLEQTPINIRSLTEQVCIQFAERATSKGIEVIMDIPPDMHTTYLGDELRIKQILLNLIGNAIKFTEVGSVTVQVRLLHLNKVKDCELNFAIVDTGCGIPHDKLEQIFSPFSQADGSTSRIYGGTGLGLSICKRLIELMRGKINVESKLHEGSSFQFTIKLPFHEAVHSVSERKFSFNTVSALIVDDLELNCQILKAQLGAWQIESEYVTSSLEALELLKKSNGKQYNILITDYNMPGMDGIELIKSIRGNPEYLDVEIILLSSIGTDLINADDQSLNIKIHLHKPLKQEKLFQAISKIFNKSYIQEPVITLETQTCTPESFFGKRILVAEDNVVNQGLARIMLEDMGCKVSICNDGREAFEMFRNQKFDLIFMDCQMPIVDGYEATKKIRTFEQNLRSHIPIIALTANVTMEDKEKCKKFGMDDYVSKPYSQKDLYQVLSKWLKQDEIDQENSVQIAVTQLPSGGTTMSEAKPNDIIIDPKIISQLKSFDKPGTPSVLKKLIELYIQSMDNKLDELKSDFSSKNMLNIHQTAHMLKSSSASIGATAIADLFKQLEAKSKEENFDDSNQLYEMLIIQYQQAKPVLESMLKDL